MLSQTARAMARMAMMAAPTPMPAFAPVDRALEGPLVEEVARAAPGVVAEVRARTVVEEEVPVITEVIVVKLGEPLGAVLTGATYVERYVLVDNTTDELDVVNVVGGGVVVKTDAELEELEVVPTSDDTLDKELFRDETAADMLEISDEDEDTIGAIDIEEVVVALFDIVLVETLVEVLVMISVVELVDAMVMVEDEESDEVVEVVSVVKEETVEVVTVMVEDVKLVDRFDMDWPATQVASMQSSKAP